MKTVAIVSLSLLATVAQAHAGAGTKGACPDVVKSSVDKAYPGSTIGSCKHETEDGHEQFEVKLTRKDGGAMELDVSPGGAILQTEEVVALSDVPEVVTKAFTAKYPKAKATRAEKETHADGGVFYELAFSGDKGKKKEATFAADGKFVEEE